MTVFNSMAQHALAALMRTHGENATRTGGELLEGIFDPVGDRPSPFQSEVGLSVRLSQQPAPTLIVSSTDAAEVYEHDTLTLRGTEYLVTRLDDDGLGVTTLRLMPAETSHADTERWQ